MDKILIIAMLILTVVIWRWYHKMVTVYYTNMLVGIFRELVVCFFVAGIVIGLIYAGITNMARSVFGSKEPTRESTVSAMESVSAIMDKSEQSQSSVQSTLAPKEEKPAYLGDYYSLILLDGTGINVSLILKESNSIKNGITIYGSGAIGALNYGQFFNVDIEKPAGNVLTCYDSQHSSTLTITFYPNEHTLEVVQETTDPDVPQIYTGTYVDGETWDGLLEERRAATQEGQLFWEEYLTQNDTTYPAADNSNQFVPISPISSDEYSDYDLYLYEGYYFEETGSVELTLTVAPNESSFNCELYWNYGNLLESGLVRPGVPTVLSEGTIITIDLDPSGNIQVLLEGEGLGADSYSLYMIKNG